MTVSQARQNGVAFHNNGAERQAESEKADRAVRRARALGWLSLGLGVPQLAAPGGMTQAIGVRPDDQSRTLAFLVGVREVTCGVGILARSWPVGWLWARVAGDMMDLALLGSALTSNKAQRNRVAAATAAVVGITILDVRASVQLSRQAGTASGRAKEEHAVKVKKTVTVNRPPAEVYQFWHDFQNLPRFMSHLQSVEIKGDGRSHWKTRAPAGTTVEWDAEVVQDQPNELIAWCSVEGADVANAGTVSFIPAPGDRGTEVRVELSYDPPAGAIGTAFAKLLGEEPNQQVMDDLRAFKQVMETGEVVHSDASVHRMPHPAQPPEQKATA